MTEALFPAYSSKFSKLALEARRTIAPELLAIVAEIENQLAEDPQAMPERLTPASIDGTTLIYRHPDPLIEVTFQIDEASKILYFFHFSAPTLQVRKSVFISYSHADQQWLAMLKKFLTVLEQQGLVKFWDDSAIGAAEDWEASIREALDSARAAVLLVSQDFLVSDFITKFELPKVLADAKHQGKKIFWIPVSPSTVFETHHEITRFQSPLPDPKTSLEELGDADRKKVLVEISRNIAAAISN